MPFLYGNHVVKAHLGRITEDTPEHQGVVVFSMNDIPLVRGPTMSLFVALTAFRVLASLRARRWTPESWILQQSSFSIRRKLSYSLTHSFQILTYIAFSDVGEYLRDEVSFFSPSFSALPNSLARIHYFEEVIHLADFIPYLSRWWFSSTVILYPPAEVLG